LLLSPTGFVGAAIQPLDRHLSLTLTGAATANTTPTTVTPEVFRVPAHRRECQRQPDQQPGAR
jgi:hypothetical protein